jgi:hypothetical protein
MINEPEIEAKKAYCKALKTVRRMRRAGKSTAEILRMGEGGGGRGECPSCRAAIG